jgi:hypothetical protein
MLHEQAERVLRAYLSGRVSGSLRQFAQTLRTWDDTHAPLLDFCFGLLESKMRKGTRVYIERKARLLRDDGSEINYGHLDLFLVHPDQTADLIDWKFGSNPVVPAKDNRQGWGYAAAMGQAFPDVVAITIVFVMPRLRWVTEYQYPREQFGRLRFAIQTIIDRAEALRERLDPADLNPGAACEYCRRLADCPAYLRTYGKAVARLGGLELPTTLDLTAITTPESAAMAKAWMDFVDLASKDIKARVEEIARINGGAVEARTATGEVVRYELRQRGISRRLGNAVEVAEALRAWVDPAALLGAADLSLEKTLEVASAALLECRPELETKKAAREAILDLLDVHGLVSKPDGKIEYLKRSKTKHTE